MTNQLFKGLTVIRAAFVSLAHGGARAVRSPPPATQAAAQRTGVSEAPQPLVGGQPAAGFGHHWYAPPASMEKRAARVIEESDCSPPSEDLRETLQMHRQSQLQFWDSLLAVTEQTRPTDRPTASGPSSLAGWAELRAGRLQLQPVPALQGELLFSSHTLDLSDVRLTDRRGSS